jgi:glutathione peroxidase
LNLQENGNGVEILNTLKYVRPGDGFEPKFPIFEKLEVNGEKAHPIFKFLRERLPVPCDDSISFMTNASKILWAPVTRGDIAWNFEKFLITPDGKPHRRYSRHYLMTNIQSEIKKLIDEYKVK